MIVKSQPLNNHFELNPANVNIVTTIIAFSLFVMSLIRTGIHLVEKGSWKNEELESFRSSWKALIEVGKFSMQKVIKNFPTLARTFNFSLSNFISNFPTSNFVFSNYMYPFVPFDWLMTYKNVTILMHSYNNNPSSI